MVYNITYIGNSTSFLVFIQRVNSHIMQGWLGTLILIAVFGITFMSFVTKTEDPKRSICASAFVCMVLSLLMMTLNLVPQLAFWLSVIVFGISAGLLREK